MSWQAKRYRKKEKRSEHELACQVKDKITEHHVPPTSTCPDFSKQFVLLKDRKGHEAYHQIFRNVGNFTKALKILENDWCLFVAFTRLFGECKTFNEAAAVLKNDWWEPNRNKQNS
ncbi:MAG: hypothetical protein Q7K16_02655 [Candidatus Azambacteria bacterium]|nr:hypothetical protein [Candidatus Azambacteria bacterium]